MKILTVDDHPLVMHGLIATLESHGFDYDSAASCTESLNKLKQADFDLIILDIGIPIDDGQENASPQAVIRTLVDKTSVPILAISGNTDLGVLRSLKDHGVKGFYQKGGDTDELLRAIDTVNDGEEYYPSDISDGMAEQEATTIKNRKTHGITRREAQIILDVAEGKTNQQIAYDRNIADATVACHLRSVFSKLNVHTRIHCVNKSKELGLID